MIGNNIGNPIGGVINLGGTDTGQAVTANMTWGASVEKSVGKNITANYDWAASVTKAVSFAVSVSMTWAGSVTKNVATSLAAANFSWAGSVAKNVGKGVIANLSWFSAIARLIQNATDTTNLSKPVNAILAKAMRMKKDRWEFERMPGQGGEKVTGKASGVGMLKGDPPSFTTTTKKL